MRRSTIILALAALAAATAARAAPYPAEGVTARDVAAVLQAKGYQATLDKDGTGDPMVRSAVDGTKFQVVFYDCDKTHRCGALEFLVGFDLPDGMALARLNKWNRDQRFGHAYLDDENDPYIQLDLNTDNGFTSESLGGYVETWASLVPHFKRYIDGKDD
ncbi:YbjN domain-containing protein [Caulobacter sp. KR2-114]|uniref:YbjN domain-containing protein n=1 Tax=Caulobacter sp. KR2-114 TaxID=3400912 RepID=UPI003BFF70DC